MKRGLEQTPNRRLSYSEEETKALAQKIAPQLPSGAVVCLFGDLGAGKTSFIRGIVETYGIPSEEVTSPTFTYLNIYEGKIPIYHFDLYRLEGVEQFLDMGFESYLGGNALTFIEWSERITSLLEQFPVLTLQIIHRDKTTRELQFHGPWPNVLSL